MMTSFKNASIQRKPAARRVAGVLDRVANLQPVETPALTATPRSTRKLDGGTEAFAQRQAPVRGQRRLTFRRPAQQCEPDCTEKRYRRQPGLPGGHTFGTSCHPGRQRQPHDRRGASHEPTQAEEEQALEAQSPAESGEDPHEVANFVLKR